MNKNYLPQDDGSFVVRNYNETYPFSNFLPGIAGIWGVPIWVFYVNRAQGVISFGIQDKDHCFLEFFPANKAYALAPFVGFRTFLKINGKIYHEPFRVISGHKRDEKMIIRSSSLEIIKTNHHLGLEFKLSYFTLPNTPVGALVRVLSIKNNSAKKMHLEILDGLPRVVPFGANNLFLKDLARTVEAWMHSYLYNNLALYRLIVEPKDSSQTKYVEGANFAYSFFERDGKKKFPYLVVDPEVIFAQDTSYAVPVKFLEKKFAVPIPQVTCGKTPSALSHFAWDLKPNEGNTFYSVFGSCFKSELIKKFVRVLSADFLKQKEKENDELIGRIKDNALCVSGSPAFSQYVRNTYLDNVLRGGYPYKFDSKHAYYIFSRKHGDLERDYNKFKLLPSYFSEGEANYRDINQNRRIDLFFNPFLERRNVVYFLNFIKIDGYNPLVVKGENLCFKENDAVKILRDFHIPLTEELLTLMVQGFHLGDFFKFLNEAGFKPEKRHNLAERLVVNAQRHPQAAFGEGYWIDHWRYNLDLIENFLYFYPDKVKELFLTREYLFWDDEHRVKERSRRYHLKGSSVYQWHSVESVGEKAAIISKRSHFKHFLRTKKGNIYKTNLIVKLLCLVLNKSATLDPDGIGVEMEADKPGWCDSLNGLPAIFGSSICETFEIKRLCCLLIDTLRNLEQNDVREILLPEELFHFFNRMNALLGKYEKSKLKNRDFFWWDKSNQIKEEFRRKTFLHTSGKEYALSFKTILRYLESLVQKLNRGIMKAKDKKNGLYTTYFSYQMTNYNKTKKSILPLKFKRRNIPHFLEAQVNAMRTEGDTKLYSSVKKSALFDKNLQMYRLNASLREEPLEIGRSRIFVPGWLENESIWLHMEYKYLLEVLKKGFYEQFYQDFYKCGVCFFDPARYGRNTLENSSFIVSSVYPDKNLWGKGFVARLSGATVELLNIWMVLCLGQRPFFCDAQGKLCLQLSPILKGELFTTDTQTIDFNGKNITLEKNSFAFTLFSKTLVIYHNYHRRDTFLPSCRVSQIIAKVAGCVRVIRNPIVSAPLSYRLREEKVECLDVYLD